MTTLNFHRLIMGKMDIGIYCYFIADILTKVFFLEKYVEWFFYQTYTFCSNLSDLIDCHGKQMSQFEKKKKTSHKSYGG